MADSEPRRTNPITHIVGPFTRTGGFYARSWGTYLDRQPDELPVARPTIALAAQAFRDEILLTGFSLLRKAPGEGTLDRINTEVQEAQAFYAEKGWLDDPDRFFGTPPPPTDVAVKPVSNMGRHYQRFSFDSDYVPKDGRFIYAGVADRLVHPRDQVTRLWEHWGKPEIRWYPGGHTGFFRSRPVQRFIDDALVQSGLVGPARNR